ncbi:hypothetical protein E7T06_16740 [Deinococcus sp. Arct2-2]|uniref:endo alpha-1,4 polygalactosaminidase n=1 Tax=Deinococcus sp. Arct2-2 TaxID=2568653 RepID=UPI0010A36492|nr:endo alpha-1,4 polygalactosaminidase [Deinococcus sp. Arct2-2]THF68389.1 hypothetical protein E7T06_16740 [Deinococcus sp. Arct2-2]
MKRALPLLALTVLTASLASAQTSSGLVLTSSVAQAVRKTITLGGDLKQWDGVPQYPVTLSNGVPSVPVKNSGYYSLAWDEQNLYVLGVFNQPKATVLAKLAPEAGEWWNDDVLELFVRTNPYAKAPADLHFAINPAGTRFKAYTATTDYKSAGRIEDTRWVLELAIPLNSATFPAAKTGDVWALKVGREHQKAAEYPIWPVGGDFNSPNNYGYLAFVQQAGDPAPLAQTISAALGKSPAGAPLTSRISDVGSYSVYYGKQASTVAKLNNYDLAIVQPSTVTDAQIQALHANGTRVVAYLSVGELEKNSPYAGRVPAAWVLGENKNWGSKFIDAGQSGWQTIIQEQAAALNKRGFDGFFLDTLDTADLYPKIAPGLVKIVENLRATYPDAVLVQNRGFALLNDTATTIDAVMFENFSSAYDFGKKTYGSVNGDPSFVENLAKRGLVVLALDYAQPDQTDVITRDYQRAKSYNFIPFVSTISLDQLLEVNP